MGLYKIQTTEITGNGYPKTGTLSVQTGNPWRYTVWTPNGEPIITPFVKDAFEGDNLIQGQESDDFSPTLAVCNNFWADLTPDSEPSDLDDPIYKLTKLSEAVGKYSALLANRNIFAGIQEDLWEQYPLNQYLTLLSREINFYLGALKQAQNLLTSQEFKDKLAKVNTSLFSGHTCNDLIQEFENMIGVGGVTSILPGGAPYGEPLITEEDIDGSKVPAIWNEFLSQIGFGDLGYTLEWDDTKGLVWLDVTMNWEGKNWPIAW